MATDTADNRDHTALHVLQVFHKPLLLKLHLVLGGGVAVMTPDKAFFINYFFLVLWAMKSLEVECAFFSKGISYSELVTCVFL